MSLSTKTTPERREAAAGVAGRIQTATTVASSKIVLGLIIVTRCSSIYLKLFPRTIHFAYNAKSSQTL